LVVYHTPKRASRFARYPPNWSLKSEKKYYVIYSNST
jgi:hypothetical protein